MSSVVKISLAIGACFATFIVVAILAGVRINTTPSYPLGVYLMTNDPIEKGVLVIFCPTDTPIFRQAKERGYIGAGFCPGGTSHMIKKIMAAANDRVQISSVGVLVNGILLPNSKPVYMDAEGRPLAPAKVEISTLNDNTVLLMSDYNPKSFDARYFGPMDKSTIISVVKPLWVW